MVGILTIKFTQTLHQGHHHLLFGDMKKLVAIAHQKTKYDRFLVVTNLLIPLSPNA